MFVVFERPLGYITPRPADGEEPVESMDSGWSMYYDEEGNPYYYREADGLSSYERPPEYYTPREDESSYGY